MTVLFSAVIFIYSVISLSNKTYPLIGNDFGYFVPRLLDSYLHYKVNGLSIQWYTPTFGSGMPAYPNPQHMQFTLAELLMICMVPGDAIWISTGFFILIGFISSYFLFEDVFGFKPFPSALGSIILNVNGFILSHTIVGHLGYQAFPLLPFLLLGLFHPSIKPLYKSILLALILSINIHGGGFYVIAIYLLSMIATIPILLIRRPQILNWKNLGQILALTTVFTFMLSGSKLYAISSFIRWFPREIEDNYIVNLLQGLYGIFLQFFGSSILLTAQRFFGFADLADYIKFTQSTYGDRYGLWEFDTSSSPAIVIVWILALLVYIFSANKSRPSKRTILLMAISLAGLWLITEFRLTNGFIYPYLRRLPLIKSLHVNLRFAAAYLLPLSTLTVFGFDYLLAKLKSGPASLLFFLLLSITSLIPLNNYVSIPVKFYQSEFNIRQADIIYNNMRAGETYPIRSNIFEIFDIDTFQNNASSLSPYEPIFGYKLENFHPLTHPGPVSQIENNYFNVTNPASFVFPEENNLTIFERISTEEQDKFDQFINHKQPNWNRPIIQKILDLLMLCSALLVSLIGIINLGYYVKKKFSRTAI